MCVFRISTDAVTPFTFARPSIKSLHGYLVCVQSKRRNGIQYYVSLLFLSLSLSLSLYIYMR